MPIQCPECKKQLSTEDGTPRFCSGCGTALENLVETVDAEITRAESKTGSFGDVTEAFAVGLPKNVDETLAHGSTGKSGRPPGGVILPPGSFIGPFQVESTLGQGGMGTVYKAVHSKSGQTVALKLLSKTFQSTQESIKRFQRESQVAASINHPRSTFVYQAGEHEGQFYITMELMTGGTLEDVVRKAKKLPMGEAVDYVLDMISGLKAAHDVGIVHRDLKPSNCFIDQTDRVKIGDFGLAKSFVAESSLTQTGTFMGTPQFAAPEQLRANEVDERADIYAIGGTLFYLLCGRAPFVGNAAQVIAGIASEPPPKVISLVPEVPIELSRIINQTLEKDPARRPENLEELRRALLPFSTRGATTADIGRRMAAFYLDNAVIFMIIMFLAQVLGVCSQFLQINSFNQVFFANIFFAFFASAGYFAIQEWRWGTTFGKWLLGMRVVTKGNRSPGLLAAIVRGCFVPGISYALNAVPAYLMEYEPDNTFQGSGILSLIELQAVSLLTWLPNVVVFLGAKMATGFRGFHEIASGTRVVRLAGALEYERPRNAPVTVPLALENAEADTPAMYGDYEAIGFLARRIDGNSRVLLGRDLSLDRDVWIVENPHAMSDASKWEKRKSVARPTRLRILTEKTEGEPKWVITESVKGMPLSDYVDTVARVSWESFRPLMRELAYELAKGEQEGTLPTRIGLTSVWIDSTGRTKLLDQPLLAPTSEEGEFDVEKAELSPFRLITVLLDGFITSQSVPAHVLTFRRELEVFRHEEDALKKVGDRLGELSDRPSSWRWDDRLGALAITIGVEYSMAGSLMIILSLVFPYLFDFSMATSGVAMFIFASVVAFLMGACLGGGPVFRLSGVLLRRNKTLEPASSIRCGFRNWVAWSPVILTSVCIAILIHYQLQVDTSSGTLQTPELPMILIFSLLLVLAANFFMLLGCVYSIFRPARGLPDLIARTKLIRK